jgi:hypothetical protein
MGVSMSETVPEQLTAEERWQMYKTFSRNIQRALHQAARSEPTPKRHRPPRQRYRPPLTVNDFASAREYLEAREQRRSEGRRILYPTN